MYIAMNRFKIILGREDDFINWTKSDAFRKAHKGAGEHSDIYIGHPEFKGFDVII